MHRILPKCQLMIYSLLISAISIINTLYTYFFFLSNLIHLPIVIFSVNWSYIITSLFPRMPLCIVFKFHFRFVIYQAPVYGIFDFITMFVNLLIEQRETLCYSYTCHRLFNLLLE